MTDTLEKGFGVGMIFVFLAFLMPYAIDEIAANASSSGVPAPIITIVPYLLLIFGIIAMAAGALFHE